MTSSLIERATVLDAMHPEVLTCPAGASLALVARMMAAESVDCVVVEGAGDGGRNWAILSDVDLVAAASLGSLDAETAGRFAAREFLTVAPDEGLGRAAEIMVARNASRLIVIDPASDRPIGVLSTLDVARAMTEAIL
jgi:CBS domain-containing protein